MPNTVPAAALGLRSLRSHHPGAGVALAGIVAADAGPVAKSPDAELVRLGALFDAAWEAEAACWRAVEAIEGDEDRDRLDVVPDAAVKRTEAIADEIAKLQATSLAGLLVKVRVCSWCHGGEPFDGTFLDDGGPGWSPTRDFKMAEAILHDLLAIDGRSVPPT